MDSTVRRALWGAFIALMVLIALGLALTIIVLRTGRQQEFDIVRGSEPLLDAMQQMDSDISMILAASRGYLLTQQTQFLQQYDDAVRDFDKQSATAVRLATASRDAQLVSEARRQFREIRGLTDQQIQLMKEGKAGNANEYMLEAARIRRSVPDYAGTMLDEHRRQQAQDLEQMANMRQGLTMLMVVLSIVIILVAAYTVWRIEHSLTASIELQVRRTEAIIAGMSDGVMLVDREGRTVFINPAGQELLERRDVGVSIDKQAEVYRLRDNEGLPIDARELPAARALSTGKRVSDVTMLIACGEKQIAISMSATPVREDRRVSGVIVTFRDITQRRRMEEEMHLQAERAQILADAGAFFSSNIDPVWVTQAIAERVAEVLGDWAAVILKTADSNELRVAAIHHRDMASIGLAWSYIYRQPLTVGEGIIGQVVSTGYPALMSNVGRGTVVSAQENVVSYHAPAMQLASLLILPLRTRRELLGALVIAANDPARRMTDDKLPLAEVLAERAALAVENAKLYTEQVEARRKVEDLSRLKDEFLSIASHELRTPVTSIKGYTQLAKTLIRENDLSTSEEYLDIALDQIDRMSRLIVELLDVSRIETGRLEIRRETIQWTEFVRDVVHRHTAVTDRRFHINVHDGTATVHGDRDRLEQVLANLLENSVKYSPDGSEILVSVDLKPDQVVTSVTDRGMGIPADELAQVFERFHRGRHVSSTNYGGLGLGLYITKQIVERHGGSIWVDSKEGVGTTFTFSLPLVSVSAEQEPASVPQQQAVTHA
jgi:signal transduction histidine kinase/CHASE3 domain sensor protein